MWSQRILLCPARYTLILSILAFPGLIADRAASAAPRASADSTAARPAVTAPARRASPGILLAAEEKQRVPKPPDQTRHKPSTEKPAPKGVTVDEDESSTSSCIGDCLGGFFGSLFSSAGPPPPPEPVSALREEAQGWVVGDRAWLRAPQTLWDRPGGEPEARAEAGSLPHGAPVVVVETYASAAGMWLRVRPMDGVEPAGWIPASVASVEPPLPSGPKAPRERPTWGIQLALGGGGLGPAELNTEYRSGAFRAEAQYLRFLPKQWQSSAGLGWRYGEGNPQVLYQTSTTIEEPANSKLWMLDIGARGGQRYTDDSGFRFDWLLGPALYYVHERADVTTFDRTTQAILGTSVESLGRWAGGGDLRLGFGWKLENGEIGLLLDGYVMAWTGHAQKSLSSDFVQGSIHGFDISVAFTVPAP